MAQLDFPSTLSGNWCMAGMTADRIDSSCRASPAFCIYRRENKRLEKIKKQNSLSTPIKLFETKETPNMESLLQKYVIDHHQKTIAGISNEELYIALLNYKQASA